MSLIIKRYWHTLAAALLQKHAEQNYCDHYDSIADFAEELTESSTVIPKHLAYYIDYDRMARDMEMSGDIFIVGSASNGFSTL